MLINVKNNNTNNFIKFRRAIVIFFFLFFSLSALETKAAVIEKIDIGQNGKIEVLGSCGGSEVIVQIFSATSTEPFYTAGSICRDGKFVFKDDLGYWKTSAGDYRIRIYENEFSANTSSTEQDFLIEKIFQVNDPESKPNDIAAESIDDSSLTVENTGEANNAELDKEGFLQRIFDAFKERFLSAVIFIKELVTEKIRTKELCLGESCIFEAQLKKLLNEEIKQEPEPMLSQTASSTVESTPEQFPRREDTKGSSAAEELKVIINDNLNENTETK